MKRKMSPQNVHYPQKQDPFVPYISSLPVPSRELITKRHCNHKQQHILNLKPLLHHPTLKLRHQSFHFSSNNKLRTICLPLKASIQRFYSTATLFVRIENVRGEHTCSYATWKETNFTNSSVRLPFLLYSIKPILGIYETITSSVASVIVTDRSVGPAWKRTEEECIETVGRRRDNRKEVKILSRAADHRSRFFGREPRDHFLFCFGYRPRYPALARETLRICMRSVTD